MRVARWIAGWTFVASTFCTTMLPARVIAATPEAVPNAIVVPESTRFTIQSIKVGKGFSIDVIRIGSIGPPAPADARLPVVFVTDNDLLGLTASSIALLGARTGQLPSLFVVGIGYEVDKRSGALPPPLQSLTRRAVDFTPVGDEGYLKGVRPVTEQIFGVPWPDGARLGHAHDFLAFIDEELKPRLTGQYPMDMANAALVGHSLGGLFTLHVLFTSPDSFARYVAISPPAGFGNGVLFSEEEKLAVGDRKSLFVGLGALDLPEVMQATARLDAQIRSRGRPELRYGFQQFDGATHESVFPAALMAGLRWVFEAPRPSYAVRDGAVAAE